MSKRLAVASLTVLLSSGFAGGQTLPAPATPAAPTPAVCPGNPTALGTARELTVDPARTIRVGLKTYPRTLDLADHEVVLTFDDGPSARTTPLVLAALERDCVRATFFLIGRNAEAARALVRREIADGDTVAHHTWSHPAATERGLPEAEARADIEHGFAADDAAAYGAAAAAHAPRVPFFRFPGFADTPALLAWLGERHVAVFGADLWASDWVKQTPEAELDLLMGRLNKDGRGIILLHDVKEQTAQMMPALIAALKAGHYHVVAITPGPGPTALRAAPAGWSSETERTIAAVKPRLVSHATGPVAAPGPALDPLP